MTTIQLTGKPAEVRRQFAELTLPEDAQICLTVDELTPQKKAQLENAEMMRKYDEEFAQYRGDDGVVRIPNSEAATLEQVRELIYRSEMEDDLGENWEEVLKQMQEVHESNAQSYEETGSAAA